MKKVWCLLTDERFLLAVVIAITVTVAVFVGSDLHAEMIAGLNECAPNCEVRG